MKKSKFIIVKIIAAFILCVVGIGVPLRAWAAPRTRVDFTRNFLTSWYTTSPVNGTVRMETDAFDFDRANYGCAVDNGPMILALVEGSRIIANVNLTITGDGVHNVVCGEGEINSGITYPIGSFDVSIDTTPPTYGYAGRTTPNAYGWNNTDVLVSFSHCSDALSGVYKATNWIALTGEGAGQVATGTCTDFAGNVASVSVTDINIDKTPPVIANAGSNPAPNSSGWSDGEVTTTWSCADAISGVIAPSISQTITTQGVGQSVTGTCTDRAGNTVSNTVTGINIDLYPPTNVKLTAIGPHVNSEWFTGPVTIKTTGVDFSDITCTYNQSQASNTAAAGVTFAGSCTDAVGRVTKAEPIIVKIDMDPPTILYISTPPDPNSWSNKNLFVTWRCADTLSGAVSSTGNQTITTEGAGQMFAGVCTDKAGNIIKGEPVYFNLDNTPPTISYVGSDPEPDSSGWIHGPATFLWTCSDALSGVVTSTVVQKINKEGQGLSVTGTCKDQAGNTASNTVSGINIKFDGSVAGSDSPGSQPFNPTDAAATQNASGPGAGNRDDNPGFDFDILFYIFGGAVVAVLIGWLIFFLKKK